MDPDNYTVRVRVFSFLKLYSKILLLGVALFFSTAAIFFVFGWVSDGAEEPESLESVDLGQVLAESDSQDLSGGVTFSIPTDFTSEAIFGAGLTSEQDTNLNGDVYYKGEQVDLAVISEGLEIDTESLSNALVSGPGIKIEGDETLEVSNTGVLSVNGETGDLEIPILDTIEIDELISEQNIFKNILVPNGDTISATSNDDSLTFIPGTGISLLSDSNSKSITITSSFAQTAIENIYGTENQVISTKNGQDITLSLPQDIHSGAEPTFGGLNIADALSIDSDGVIQTLGDLDFVLGGENTGDIQLISQDMQALLVSGDLVTIPGDLKMTSLSNGVLQTVGGNISGGAVDLGSETNVEGTLSSEFGGTGTSERPLNGQVLIGSGLTGEYEPRSIGVGAGISIARDPYSLTVTNTGVTKISGGVRHILVNGSYSPTGVTGDITLTLPQILDTVATPTFSALELSSIENMITFASESTYSAYLTMEELSGDRTYTLPNESGTICLTTGNCAGEGGGIVGSGTVNYIPKFSNSNTLTSSLLFDNGTSVGVGTSSPIAGAVLDISGSLRLGASGGQYDILGTSTADGSPSAKLYWGDRVICDSNGSCSGTDGGGLGSTGSSGYLAMFGDDADILEDSIIYNSGTSLGIGTTDPSGFVSISGGTDQTALVVNQIDDSQNVLSAALLGDELMTLSSDGDLDLLSGVFKHEGSLGQTVESFACVTTSGGIVTGSGDCPTDPSSEIWDSQSGVIFAADTDNNFALGGTTINNSKFAVLNMSSGDPTIWLRQSLTQTLSITSSGTFKTINDSDITLQSGNDLVLNAGSGEIIVSGDLKTPEGEDITVEPDGDILLKPEGYDTMKISKSGVTINTITSRGALTIKETSSLAYEDESGGGGGTTAENLITNEADSDFTSDTGNWDLDAGWSISGGVLTFVGGGTTAELENQYMNNYIQPGNTYTVQFELVSTTDTGSIGVQVGNTQSGFIWADMPPWDYGVKTTTVTPSAAGNLYIHSNGWQGTITDVKITSEDVVLPTPTPSFNPSTPGFVMESSDGTLSPIEMRAGGSGLFNTFVGYSAGENNRSGISNAAFGAHALESTTTAASNSAFGTNALYSATTGENNSAFGAGALYSNIVGDLNVALGYRSGYNVASGSGNVFIGPNAGPSSSSTFSDQLYIANSVGSPLIWGDFSLKKVGINLTDPTDANNTFSVAGSMCVTTDGVCDSNTAGTIYTENTVVTGADLAENYISSEKLEVGDVVSMANDGNSQAVLKAESGSNTLLGVVSSNPGVTLNSEAETDSSHEYIYPIALSGRVPTKVSVSNGEIKAGDPLTVGEIPGVAVKATSSTYIVGRALEEYSGSGVGKIMMYASVGWYSEMRINDEGNLVTDDVIFNHAINSTLPTDEPDKIFEDLKDGTTTNSDISDIETNIATLEGKIQDLEKQDKILGEILHSEDRIASVSSKVFAEANDLQLDTITLSKSVHVGELRFDAVQNSINTGDEVLRLQSESQGDIEFFNELITFTASGDINVKGTVKAEKIEIDSTDEENASIGVGSIPEGETSVVVETKAVTENSNIFITPKTLYEGSLAVTEQKDQESFKVEIENASDVEILFNWWIVN